MIDDKIDVDVYPNKKGWNVVVSYWYYDRNKNERKIQFFSNIYLVYRIV